MVKSFIALTAILLSCFFILIYFSAIESHYECKGAYTNPDKNPQSAVIYLKLSEYRIWVKLWADSDASLWLEHPNLYVMSYLHLVKSGSQYFIHQFDDGDFKGMFSKLSKTLALKTRIGFFDGTCQKVDI